jgi:hypothetical protein
MEQTREHIKTNGIPWINILLSNIYQELSSFDNTLVKIIKENSFKWDNNAQ